MIFFYYLWSFFIPIATPTPSPTWTTLNSASTKDGKYTIYAYSANSENLVFSYNSQENANVTATPIPYCVP